MFGVAPHPGQSPPTWWHIHLDPPVAIVMSSGRRACEHLSRCDKKRSSAKRAGRWSSRTIVFASGEVPRLPAHPPARDDNGECQREGISRLAPSARRYESWRRSAGIRVSRGCRGEQGASLWDLPEAELVAPDALSRSAENVRSRVASGIKSATLGCPTSPTFPSCPPSRYA